MVALCAALFVLTQGEAAPRKPSTAASPAPPQMQLGDAVRPLAYEAELTVDPARDRFSGHLVIHVELAQPTDFFWMNAKKLDIRSATLTVGTKTLPAKVTVAGTEFIGLRFASAVPAGRAVLTFDYDGVIDRNETQGVFRQQDANNWYAFTQFEATDARRAFPSFDEPGFKVPWHLSLIVPANDVAAANMPIASEEPYVPPPAAEPLRRRGAPAAAPATGGAMKRVRFAPTPPLPSYLVAFAVGPFDVVDGGRAGRKGTALRYLVPKGRGADTLYAKESVPRILELLEDYFGQPYPYEKLDSVAIPVTVGFGAMENPGLITYQINLLVARPDQESERFKRYMAGVAAHEMAHQWFGDLVTMQWWNDVWLNESFASWMGTKVVDRFAPAWDVKLGSDRSRLRAFHVDRLATTRAVRLPVNTRDDLGNAFDAIAYQKGAEILSMFETAAGEERFRNGVRRYLYEHANGNAKAEDFFNAIAAEVGTDGAMTTAGMKSFVEQPGMPRLAVSLDCGPDGTSPPKLVLTQSRFIPSRPAGEGASQRWVFPACFQFGRGGDFNEVCGLINEPRVVLSLPAGESCPQWVLPNRGGVGYFVSSLTPELSQELVRAPLLGPEAVPALNDASVLAETGEWPIDLALDFAARYANNRQNAAANAAVDLAMTVKASWLDDQADRDGFARYVQRNFGTRARALGWTPKPGERDGDGAARAALVPWFADVGNDVPMQREATRLAREWTSAKSPLPNGAATVLVAAARYAQGASGRELLGGYLDALGRANPAERGDLHEALGSFREQALANAAYDALFSGRFDARGAITALSEGAAHDEGAGQAALVYLRAHMDTILDRLPSDGAGRLVRAASETCTPAAKGDLQAAFGGPRFARVQGGARSFAQAAEALDICLVARQSQRPALKAFLAKQQ